MSILWTLINRYCFYFACVFVYLGWVVCMLSVDHLFYCNSYGQMMSAIFVILYFFFVLSLCLRWLLCSLMYFFCVWGYCWIISLYHGTICVWVKFIAVVYRDSNLSSWFTILFIWKYVLNLQSLLNTPLVSWFFFIFVKPQNTDKFMKSGTSTRLTTCC